MTPPRYIGPNDVPVIQTAVQQMLRDGMPRAEIAGQLMAEYVPHDDVARLIARVPSPEDAHRYRHLRRILAGLALLCIAWYVSTMLLMIVMCVLRASSAEFARCTTPFLMAAAYVGALSMMCLHLRRNDGMAFFLGTIFGAVVLFDCLTGVLGDHILVRVAFLSMALAGAVMSAVSLFVRRRYFPDLRLFSAPRKDERGMYIFTDSAGHHAAPSARPRA